MIKKVTFILSFFSLFLLFSCTNIISELSPGESSLYFTLGEKVASDIEKSLPDNNAISDNSSLTVNCYLQEIKGSEKSITLEKGKLSTAEFYFSDIPFNKNFKVIIEVLYKDIIIYHGESDYLSLTAEDSNANINLVVKQVKSKITYETQEGIIKEPETVIREYFISDEILVGDLPKVEKEGFAFEGWYFNKEGTKPVTELGKNNFIGNITLYAKWTPDCSVVINGADATLTSDSITGKLKKDNKIITSFTIPDNNENKVVIEKLEPGNYSVELTGTNTKENYSCDSFSLINEKNKDIKVNVTPNNYYFVDSDAADGGNGILSKPLKYPSQMCGKSISNDCTFSLKGDIQDPVGYQFIDGCTVKFVSTDNSQPAILTLLNNENFCLGNGSDHGNVTIDNIKLNFGTNNQGDSAFFIVNRESVLTLQNNVSCDVTKGNAIVLVNPESSLVLNEPGKINSTDKTVYIGAGGKITFKSEKAPVSTIKLNHLEDGQQILSDESYKSLNISSKIIIDNPGDYKVNVGGMITKYGRTEAPAYLKGGQGGTYGTGGEYVYFGDWPQTVKPADVVIQKTKVFTQGDFSFDLGSDNFYYTKILANLCSSDDSLKKYSDSSAAKDGYCYFRLEPIKWRVLNKNYDNNKKLLLAEEVLMGRAYDNGSIVFTGSEVCNYLNNNFSEAFINKELLVGVSKVNNAKVFLLSKEEVLNSFNGFSTSDSYTDSRRQRWVTDYAIATGAYTATSWDNSGRGWWWLRDLAYGIDADVQCVATYGDVLLTNKPDNSGGSVVPAICIN